MSDTKPLHPVWRVFGALNIVLDKAVVSLNALGTLIIIALMVLICTDVVGRNVLATSLPGVIELAELAIVSIVFLQIADTLRSGKLMRSDALIRKISGAFPRVGLVLNIGFDVTGAVLFYFITSGAFDRFSKAWSGGFYTGNLGSFTAPTWPMELCVALGSGLMCLLFVTQAFKGGAALLRGSPPPAPQTPDFGDEYTS
ncbi:MAG: TRAP transporter small permease [Tateyamaria sp.]|uniref:TRAP transporter small permease subunit n=1 Tax=Tateyamaria sp. TaxID=1929288 RepID=UPI00329AB2F8